MKNNRTNKPVKNFQKKKYYTNRNQAKTVKTDRGTYAVDPLTWECTYTPPQKKNHDQ